MFIPRQHRCRQGQHTVTHKNALLPACRRVAIFGGDARQERRWAASTGAGSIRFFGGRRCKGNGELRRLMAAVRAGSVDLVVILARWNGHSATRVVRRFCRRAGVDVVVVS